MKRLIKFADNAKSIDKFINSVAVDGRQILKDLEKFKFKIEQCTNVTANNPELGDKIVQNSDMIDKLMSGLYSVCYDLENIDLVSQYDNDQINMSEQDSPDSQDESGYDLNKEIPEPDETDDTDTTENVEEEPAEDTDNANEEESSTDNNGEESEESTEEPQPEENTEEKSE